MGNAEASTSGRGTDDGCPRCSNRLRKISAPLIMSMTTLFDP
jgi:hypothetical protein